MDANGYKRKIEQLMAEHGWTEYKLIKESGLSHSTIKNILNENKLPTMPTLETLCDTFHITLAEFFSEGELTVITAEQKELYGRWNKLDENKKCAILSLLDVMQAKDKGV